MCVYLYIVNLSEQTLVLNGELVVWFSFLLLLHSSSHGGSFSLLMVSSVQHMPGLALTYLVRVYSPNSIFFSSVWGFDSECLLLLNCCLLLSGHFLEEIFFLVLETEFVYDTHMISPQHSFE